MRIDLTDREHVVDLLRFLRERGCIAYVLEGAEAIEVLRPHAFGKQEVSEVDELLACWLVAHPEADASLKET